MRMWQPLRLVARRHRGSPVGIRFLGHRRGIRSGGAVVGGLPPRRRAVMELDSRTSCLFGYGLRLIRQPAFGEAVERAARVRIRILRECPSGSWLGRGSGRPRLIMPRAFQCAEPVMMGRASDIRRDSRCRVRMGGDVSTSRGFLPDGLLEDRRGRPWICRFPA